MNDFLKINIPPITEPVPNFGPNYTLITKPTHGIFTPTAFVWSKELWNFIVAISVWYYVLFGVIAVAISLDLTDLPSCSIFCENP